MPIALTTADNLVTFRWVVKHAAARNGIHATFMPKPLYGENGSGMHINQSLSRGGQNAFFDPSDELQLSATAYGYIAGLLDHLPALTAICNPTVNSYKRLIPGYEAPVYIAWSPGNRSAAIRIPAKRGHSTRVELRTPDPDGEPVPGVRVPPAGRARRRPQGRLRRRRPWTSTSTTSRTRSRPISASRACRTTSRTRSRRSRPTRCCKTALGDHIYDAFISEKRKEWSDYREQVHDWEFKQYLDRY